MSTEWLKKSAGDLGRAIAAGQIDPVELTEAYLEAIAAHDIAHCIYARTTPDRALAEAAAAAKRARAGHVLGPLDGVPISWKDLFDTAGVATEAGSALLEGRVPERDAEVLINATAQGLVCLGKTHMSELAFSGLGLNPVTQTPPSVNDLDAVAGGSSSGAATSVAFGLAACGIGSDTGGSVRIPSAWNDLVGLKTTSGRLSLKGVVPLVASFDTVGPLCRNVEDAGLMLAALEGGKPADLAGASLSGSRFLVLENMLADGDEAPITAFENAVDRLAAAGARIERASLALVDAALALSIELFTPEAYATWQPEIDAAHDKMFRPILERFRAGRDFAAWEVIRAWQSMERMRDKWNATAAGYDAVLLPTSLILPPNQARLLDDPDYYVRANLLALRNTRVGNLFGLSALTLPTGTPSAGIMLLGKPMGEEHLLRLGAAAERALG